MLVRRRAREVGRIALADSAPALLGNPDIQSAYLGSGE
jgi:hypothetical protein